MIDPTNPPHEPRTASVVLSAAHALVPAWPSVRAAVRGVKFNGQYLAGDRRSWRFLRNK